MGSGVGSGGGYMEYIVYHLLTPFVLLARSPQDMGWVKGGEEYRVRQGFRGEGKRGGVWLEGIMRRNKEAKR